MLFSYNKRQFSIFPDGRNNISSDILHKIKKYTIAALYPTIPRFTPEVERQAKEGMTAEEFETLRRLLIKLVGVFEDGKE